eukprot:8359181-Pyramimonas_sp.AAC.1
MLHEAITGTDAKAGAAQEAAMERVWAVEETMKALEKQGRLPSQVEMYRNHVHAGGHTVGPPLPAEGGMDASDPDLDDLDLLADLDPETTGDDPGGSDTGGRKARTESKIAVLTPTVHEADHVWTQEEVLADPSKAAETINSEWGLLVGLRVLGL